MKLRIKILRTAAVVTGVVIIILFMLSVVLQSKADVILNAVNNNISTKIETGSVRISLLRKFPRASLELKDVFVHSSPGFDVMSFADASTDTLLSARNVSVVFSMTDLILGHYTVNRIRIKSGRLNLLTDKTGKINYDIYWKESTEKDPEGGMDLNLDRIYLTGVRTLYNDLSSSLIIDGVINEGQLKSRFSGNNIDFHADTQLGIDFFRLDNLNIGRSFKADVDLNLQKTDSGVKFSKGIIRIEEWDFLLAGFVSSEKYIDLEITGNNIELSKISNFFPPEYQQALSDYRSSGLLEISGTITGPYAGNLSPDLNFSFSLENANVKNAKSRLAVDNFSFDGTFATGPGTGTANGSFIIQNLTGRLGSALYKGSLNISDFSRPSAEIKLSGRVYPAELMEFFNLKHIGRAAGSANLNLVFSGRLNKKEKYTFSDFLSLSSASEIVFNSFSIGFIEDNLWFEDVNGSLLISRKSLIKEMNLILNGQRIRFDGEVTNFPGWFAGNPVMMAVKGNIYSGSFSPESFGRNDNITDEPQKALISFPGNIVADVDFRIDTFRYKSFTGTDISGQFSYKPKMANFKSFNIKSQGGAISGNGLFAQNPGKSVTGRGSFVMSDINVNEAFITFRNFGQDFITAENLAGSLSGSLSLLMPLDSMLKPDVNSVVAEGKYILRNGALKNFEPVKQLSNFIELSELENINFHQLENDFFISESYFYVPQMDVRSSAANISVNGKHGFDNRYEYHVRVQLSELLSKKAVKKRSPVTEFGVIEDDGLGRTSLLLLVESQGDATKVSYDVKAVTAQIKNDIRNERENLKTIMSQEYNRYGDDSVPEPGSAQKPRFRISWEEGEIVKSESEEEKESRQNVLRNIFRKKN